MASSLMREAESRNGFLDAIFELVFDRFSERLPAFALVRIGTVDFLTTGAVAVSAVVPTFAWRSAAIAKTKLLLDTDKS